MPQSGRALDDPAIRAVVDHLPEMVAYFDEQERCQFASLECARWFGHPVPLVGLRLRDVLGAPLYERNLPRLKATLGGAAQQFDFDLPNPTGGPTRPSHVAYIPDEAEGSVRGFFIVLADQRRGEKLARAKSAIDHAEERIAAALAGLSLDTEVEAIAANLREAQAALTELRSLERASRIGAAHHVNLADVVSSMEESVVAVDLELRVQVWSPGAEKLYGWRAAQTIGKPIFSFTRPEWTAADIDAWRQALLVDGKLRQVGRRTLESGQEAVIETSYAVVRDPAGEAIGIIGIGRDVTERETSREALAASEARFRAVLGSMSEGVIVRGADGRFVDANDAALRLLGLQADHLRGEKPIPAGWRSEHADGTPFTLPQVVAALRAGPVEAAGVVERGDGQRTWLRLRAQPLRSAPEGPITGVVTTLSDISAMREAQRIELDRARLAGLEERSNEAEMVMREGVVVQANDRAMQTYGSLVGRNLASLRAEFSVQTTFPSLADAEQRPQRYQTEHRRGDGTTFPVEVSTRPFVVGGQVSIHLLMRDLSESRREAQQQRLLAGLIREMSDAVLLTDPTLRITEYAGASERIYGWTREEALGKHLPSDVVTEFPDGDRDRFEAALAQGQTARVTMHAQRKDGSWVDLDASYSPLRDERGTLIAWLAVTRDITRELAAKRALEAREAQLEYVIDGSTDGFFDTDMTKGTTSFSRRWAEMFGYGHDAFEAPNEWVGVPCPAEDHQRLLTVAARHARGETPSFETELQLRHGDGSLRWALVRGKVAQRDDTGRATRVSGTWTDVTARHQAEVARQAALLENERLVGELRAALQNVKTLTGLLPICMDCKKIRDDQGYWERIDHYVAAHTDAHFTHGLCPTCYATRMDHDD